MLLSTTAAAAARVRFFSKRRFSFSLQPSLPPSPCVVFVSPPNYIYNRNQKTGDANTLYYIAHNGPRYSKNPPIFMSPMPRDPSRLILNVRIVHNVIIMYSTFIYDVQYITDVSTECDRFRCGNIRAAADENLHFPR